MKLGNWTAAQDSLERVVKGGGSDASAMLSLGQCELELKQYQSAIQSLQEPLQADPTMVLTHFFLARAYRA
jgi:Tfp pilus assembly protein PilF